MQLMRQGWTRVFAVALVLGLVAPARGAGPVDWPVVFASNVVALPVAAGVEYRHVSLATSDGPLDLHHLLVDLASPTVHLGVGVAHDQLISDDEPVSSMATRSGAIAAVNADYFDIHQSGMPLNIVIANGQLLRSPWRFVALVIGKDGVARILRYRWTGTVATDTGETRPLESFNGGLPENGIMAISNVRGYGAPPPDPGVRQAVAELSGGEGDRYFVKQIWPRQAFYAPLPPNEIILLGRGTGADWIQQRLVAGMSLTVNLTTDPDWHDAQVAVGGGPLLIDQGRLVEDPDAPAAAERNLRYPSAAVGISADGRHLTFVEADGRQPGLSIGLTRPQLASYMQRQGSYQAMAFDSGGSATMVVRLPGQAQAATVNSPSDGSERPVANSVLVYSTATPGAPVRILVNNGQPLVLLAGARAAPPLIGVDAQGNPVPLTDPVQLTASAGVLRSDGLPSRGGASGRQSSVPDFVSVGGDGAIVAGAQPADGTVTVQSGAATGTGSVSVVTRLARLLVTPNALSLARGETAPLRVAGQDPFGRFVTLPQSAVLWQVTPPALGTVAAGTFQAGAADGSGVVTARLAGASADAHVTIGGPLARLVPGFEEQASFRAYPPQTVTGAVAVVAAPSRDNRQALRLQFHLDGKGSRAAYVETDLPLAGSPTGMSLWVYGDADGAWLRGAYTDANGARSTVTFARHVDWRGWKQVTAVLPQPTAYPIRWTYVYVVETDPASSPAGELFLTGLRALYSTP